MDAYTMMLASGMSPADLRILGLAPGGVPARFEQALLDNGFTVNKESPRVWKSTSPCGRELSIIPSATINGGIEVLDVATSEIGHFEKVEDIFEELVYWAESDEAETK